MRENNVINIKSEILFREAEDCFLYFNRPKMAIRRLNLALKLTPNHAKSIELKADMRFIQGKFKESLDLYKQLNSITNNDAKVIGSIANCLEVKGDFELALAYCNKAFLFLNASNCSLYKSLCELKAGLLLKLRRYEEAKNFIEKVKKVLSIEDFSTLARHNEIVNSKIYLKEKIRTYSLKVIN